MKNARGRGRGGYAFNNNNQRRNNQRMTNNGPLMTEHLQHIDLELDLLKRKREMIEHQQELLETQMMSREKSLNFENPRYFERANFQSTSNLDNNYAQYYDEPLGSADFLPLNTRKRSYQPDWEVNPSSNKRFSGGVRGGDRKYGSRSGSQSSNQFQGRGSNRRPPPRESRFADSRGPTRSYDRPRAGKVNKPKNSAPPPNKLGNKPVAERVDLVQKATAASNKVTESLILRPDVPQSNQLQGRLELVMGHLLKELKTKFGETEEYREVLQNPLMQRTVKQVLRDRIKELMMNKYIGSINHVVTPYRKRYPDHTDETLLEEVKLAKVVLHKNPETKVVQSDDPKEFFEVNMQKLVQTKLTEMFRKLEEIYGKNKGKPAAAVKELNITKDVNSENEVRVEEQCESEKKEEEKIEDEPKKEDNLESSEKEAEKPEGEKIDEEKLENGNKEELTENTTTEEGKIESEENKVEKSENEKQEEEGNTEESEQMIPLKDIEAVLPALLTKSIPRLIRLLNVNTAFEASRSFILQLANQKLTYLTAKHKATERTVAEAPVEAEKPEPKVELATHFVKVLGKPTLPKRKVMQTFLEKFKPRFVKRHKRMRNLLFVGFQNQEGVDKILAEDGHAIGKITLGIRKSDKINMIKQDNDEDEMEIKEDETSALDTSKDSVGITAELDEQIDSLLTSIREAEEMGQNDVKESGVEAKLEVTSETSVTTEVKEEKTNDTTENKVVTDTDKDVDADTENNVVTETTEDNANEQETTNEQVEETTDSQKTTADDNKPSEDGNEAVDVNIEDEKKDALPNLKSDTPATPTRASARIASTPSAIRTRRTSRLNAANEKS